MSSATANAKINLALVVGPLRPDGKHEVATVLQRIDLADHITLRDHPGLEVRGYRKDTLVRDALLALATQAGVDAHWSVEIEKRIPVGAGLGGGSSDAATALRLANETLADPVAADRLRAIAAGLGADVPFFLVDGAQFGTGDGSDLEPVEIPSEYAVVIVLPSGETKPSTAAVYEAFDRAEGFDERRAELLEALEAGDLAAFPPNDLVSSPLARDLLDLGAFRADVTGAGPAVYGLFGDRAAAETAARALENRGRTWIAMPAR